jgi:hypothetical protein
MATLPIIKRTSSFFTNFNDALKNATGVTRLWESTGRGGDGAEFVHARFFCATNHD